MFARRHSGEVRPSAVAGSFYPGKAGELRAYVERSLSQAKAASLSDLAGLIAPHAGYLYSGGVAANSFASIAPSAKTFARVLLIGPPHYVPVHGIAAPSSQAFATPLGEIPVDGAAISSLQESGLVVIDDEPHASRSYGTHTAKSGVGGRPARWCGWWMRTQKGGGPELNLAANWRHWGLPTGPRVGAVVVWSHHVGMITGRTAGGEWIVKSGNDGGAVRERPRSVAGAVFRI